MLSGLKNMDYRKLRNLICGCGACLIMSQSSFATMTDTVRTEKVIVTDSKVKYSDTKKYVASKTIGRSIIEQKGSETINEVLNSVPGIYIKDYGGLGGLKTVSVRGTSSNQTAVMIDGIKLNSSQNGAFDLGILSTDIANRIEVIRGGASALFGGNAIGGAINVLTDNNPRRNLSLSATHGAFSTQRYAAKYSDSDDGYFWIVNAEYAKSDGDFPFEVLSFDKQQVPIRKEYKRENAQSESLRGNIVIGKCFETYSISLRNVISYSDRGVPGAAYLNKLYSPAALNSKDLYSFFNFDKIINDNLIYSIKAYTKFGELNYQDSTQIGLNSDKVDNTYFDRNAIIKAKLSSMSEFGVMDFETSMEYNELRGEMLQEAAGTKAERGNFSLSAAYYGSSNLSESQELNYNAAMRYDYIEDMSAVSPMLGVSYDIEAISLETKFSYSYNFRPPSFNEMYYMNFGNMDLKPERSNSYNLGFAFTPFENISIESNLFFINTKDQIVAVPKSPITWSAQNLGRVETKGVEFNTTFIPFEWVKLDLAYTLQSAIDKTQDGVSYNFNKQLVYSPEEMLNMLLAFEKFNTLLTLEGEYISHRFTTAENTTDNMLGRYFLANVGLKYTYEIGKNTISIRFDLKNLFDNKEYQIIKNYPMPGRYWNLKISYDWR
jgi:outer membrane cobalamin receptor